MSSPITELTIDRSKWACNSNNQVRGQASFMEDSTGFKCCLGFLAAACGASNFKSSGALTTSPAFLDPEELEKLPINFQPVIVPSLTCLSFDGRTRVQPDLVNELILANDEEPDDKKREKTVKDYFKQTGITVKFVGEYLKKAAE